MKGELFKVVSHSDNTKRMRIWDSSAPMALDHRQNWILESGENEPRVRSLVQDSQGQTSLQVIQAQTSPNHEGSFFFQLPNATKVEIKKLKGISPPYVDFPNRAMTGGPRQLVSYAGSGRGIVHFEAIHSSYIAYVRSKPVFTLQMNADGYQVQPLLSGLRIKFKNQQSEEGETGKPWNLTQDQIRQCSLFRGSRWWKFSFISEAAFEGLGSLSTLKDVSDEGQFFKKLLISLFLTVLICSGLVFKFAPPTPIVTEVKEEPIVKFVAPINKPEVKHEIMKPVELPKPPEPKPEVKQPVKEEPKHQAAPPPKAAPKAPEQSKKPGTSNANAAKIAALRNVLGGALKLTGKTSDLSIKAPNSPQGLLKGDGNSLKPTDIKPEYAGKTANFNGIGGSGGGNSYAKNTGVAGGTGTGTSFVGFNDGGMAVEKGLLPEEVGKVIHDHVADVRYCHEASLLYHPNLSGKVVIQFTIDPTGKVTKASIQSSTASDPTLEKCIITRLVTWHFPKPKGGISVAVSYPFVFKVLDKE